MGPNLFEAGRIQSAIMACSRHALDTAAPLLDEAQFLKYPAENAIAKFGNALLDVLDGKSEWEQAGILYLQAVVKESNPDRRATLGIIRMNDGIHECFTDGNCGERPKVGSFHGPYHRLTGHVLLQECNHLFGGSGKIRAHFEGVEYTASVIARESARLNPRIWIAVQSVHTEKKHSANGRHDVPLIAGDDLQCFKVAPRQLALRLEELGSSSEVDGFRVQFRFGLFVK